jgi:hypothetical protein
MKKEYLLLMAIFLGSLISNVTASPLPCPKNSTITLEEWVKVKTENGLDISIATSQLNGKSYLKIKFENTTEKSLDFSWTLVKNNHILVQDMSQKVANKVSIEIFDATMLFEANQNTLKDFNIILNFKK